MRAWQSCTPVRYRTPGNRQNDKRWFKTRREAERFANTVEVAKLRGEYVNPAETPTAMCSTSYVTRRQPRR